MCVCKTCGESRKPRWARRPGLPLLHRDNQKKKTQILASERAPAVVVERQGRTSNAAAAAAVAGVAARRSLRPRGIETGRPGLVAADRGPSLVKNQSASRVSRSHSAAAGGDGSLRKTRLRDRHCRRSDEHSRVPSLVALGPSSSMTTRSGRSGP